VEVLDRYVVAVNSRNKLEACLHWNRLTRRDGAEDIAEHISAVAVNDTNVLGEEEGVRSKCKIRVPQCLHPCEFSPNSPRFEPVANRALKMLM
jgi:hypothetical protein